jgi:hypothetical protein
MIEHEMLLLDADFKVVARMVGKMKKHAGMAEEAMHHIRNVDYSCSTQDARSTFEESE